VVVLLAKTFFSYLFTPLFCSSFIGSKQPFLVWVRGTHAWERSDALFGVCGRHEREKIRAKVLWRKEKERDLHNHHVGKRMYSFKSMHKTTLFCVFLRVKCNVSFKTFFFNMKRYHFNINKSCVLKRSFNFSIFF